MCPSVWRIEYHRVEPPALLVRRAPCAQRVRDREEEHTRTTVTGAKTLAYSKICLCLALITLALTTRRFGKLSS